jgi:hypothetical protein
MAIHSGQVVKNGPQPFVKAFISHKIFELFFSPDGNERLERNGK